MIPAKLRAELSVRPGDSVVLETTGDELHVRPYREAIREAQAIVCKYLPDRERSLVDERQVAVLVQGEGGRRLAETLIG